MSRTSFDRLFELARAIFDERAPVYSLGPEISSLAELVREHATIQIDPSQVRGVGETHAATGLALSPTMAGRCADDVARTAVFVRGLHRAIGESRGSAPERPTRALYAGCGPYALLALPAMASFGPDELQFTLLDIHGASIESARTVVGALGLSDHVAAFEAIDACRYRIPLGRPPDVILSETMNACLRTEPQVAIIRHLHAQAPSAALVPESVRVDAYLVDVVKEFRFVEQDADSSPPKRDRVFLGTVFELSAETIASWTDERGDRLPAASIRIPDPLEPRYTPMLLTQVVVDRDHVLRAYDSGLTIPKHVPFDGPIRGGETLAFHYRLGSRPGLVCEAA